MKTNYESPQIEVIGIEIEDAVLSASGGGATTSNYQLTSYTSGVGM